MRQSHDTICEAVRLGFRWKMNQRRRNGCGQNGLRDLLSFETSVCCDRTLVPHVHAHKVTSADRNSDTDVAGCWCSSCSVATTPVLSRRLFSHSVRLVVLLCRALRAPALLAKRPHLAQSRTLFSGGGKKRRELHSSHQTILRITFKESRCIYYNGFQQSVLDLSIDRRLLDTSCTWQYLQYLLIFDRVL